MSSSDDIAIKVSNVSKSFKLPHEKNSSIKGALINTFRTKNTYEKQEVLKDINFEIKKGEFFGIVGRNGSGKSTLLKLLAGIYTPNKGSIHINGKLTPFIELGVGFNQELSGKENVFLNGALLGFNRKEMLAMYDEIVEFAELEKFMDQKLKNYSSGMQVRLAFSIAIRANTDTLVLDEVLAVGDANFQRKCLNYFKKLKAMKKTVVFVSHDMNAVQEFCDKAIILERGSITFEGNADKAAEEYSELNFINDGRAGIQKKDGKNTDKTKKAIIKDVEIVSDSISRNGYLKPNEKFRIITRIEVKDKISDILLGVQITDNSGSPIFGANTKSNNSKLKNLSKGNTIVFVIKLNNTLNNGTFNVACALKSQDRLQIFDQKIPANEFEVAGWSDKNISGPVVLNYDANLEVVSI